MSDPVKPLVPDALLSSGVRDDRQLAFVRLLDDELSAIDITTFVMTDAYKVDAKLLPYLVREFSLQDFVTPDLPEIVIRRLIANAHTLHAKQGYVEGTRLGLSMLGLDVDWVQWWQQEPKGAHNTHIVTVEINDYIFTDSENLLDARLIRAAANMIDVTKRQSQEIAFRLAVTSKSKAYMGTFPMSRLTITAHPFYFDPPTAVGPMRCAVAPLTQLTIIAQAA